MPHYLCRRLLETRAPGGGFQAAKYFTYIFFALAIALVSMMILLCGLHCTRRMRMRRALTSEATAAPTLTLTVPLPSSHSIRRQEQPIEMLPIKVFRAVTICHPDGERAVAWCADRPIDTIQPEQSAERKAALAARELRRALGSSHHSFQDGRRISGRRHSRRHSGARSHSRASLSIASLDLADAVSHQLPHTTAARSHTAAARPPPRPGAVCDFIDASRGVRRNPSQTAHMQDGSSTSRLPQASASPNAPTDHVSL